MSAGMRTDNQETNAVKSEMSDLRFRCKVNFNGTWEFDWASTANGMDNELYADVERWRFLLSMINSAVYEKSTKKKK